MIDTDFQQTLNCGLLGYGPALTHCILEKFVHAFPCCLLAAFTTKLLFAPFHILKDCHVFDCGVTHKGRKKA